jgi:hypothetical protein
MPITRARLEDIGARLNQYTPLATHGDNVLDGTLGISVADLHGMLEAAKVGLALLPLPEDPAPFTPPAAEEGAAPEPQTDAMPAPNAEQPAGDAPHEEPAADDAPAGAAQGEDPPPA